MAPKGSDKCTTCSKDDDSTPKAAGPACRVPKEPASLLFPNHRIFRSSDPNLRFPPLSRRPMTLQRSPRSSMAVPTLGDSLSSRGISRSRSCPNVAGASCRHVSFDRVEVRRYERIACDNPSVLVGVPLGIGWNYYTEDDTPGGHTWTVDEYEWNRPERPRTREDLFVNASRRERMLMDEWGVSRSALTAMEGEVRRIGRQRRRTVEKMRLAPLEEAMESARRKLKRVVTLRGGRREEAKLWEEAAKRMSDRTDDADDFSLSSSSQSQEIDEMPSDESSLQSYHNAHPQSFITAEEVDDTEDPDDGAAAAVPKKDPKLASAGPAAPQHDGYVFESIIERNAQRAQCA